MKRTWIMSILLSVINMGQFIYISLMFLLVGCATYDIRSKNALNLLKLKIEMDRTEVLKIMGTEMAWIQVAGRNN